MERHPSSYFQTTYQCGKLDEAFDMEQSSKMKKFINTISSKQGQKAYATRMSDFIVFCEVHERDWRDVLVVHEFLEHIHEHGIFSHGSLWSIHSMVSSIRLVLLNKRSLVDNGAMKRSLKVWTRSHEKTKAHVFDMDDVMLFLREAKVTCIFFLFFLLLLTSCS